MATMQDYQPATFLQAPLQAPPAVVADPKLVTLKSMFPEIEADVLEAMLMYHQGDVERACSMILDTSSAENTAASTQENLDEAVARALQQQLDLELAQGVQAELQAEEAARRRQEPANRAASAVESAAQKAAAGAKNLLARAKNLASKKSGPTHGTRLLDAPSDDSAAVASSWAPLSLPAYSPNYNATTDSSSPVTTAATAVDISEPAAHTPSPPNTQGSADSSSRYSSRMERARSANMQNQRSSARLPVGEQPAAVQVAVPAPPANAPPQATAQVEVPVGELI